MKIDIDKIISLEELLEDFEGVCEWLKSEKEAFIFQNNKPSHVIMTINHYQYILDSMGEQNNKPSRDEDVETILNKIGKRIFVEYYYIFKADDNPEDKLIDEGFTLNSRRSRSSSARKIFRDGFELVALKNIIQSSKLDEEIIGKAKRILKAETGTASDDSSIEEYDIEKKDMKIGKTVRFLLTRFLQGGYLTENEVESMTEKKYSKDKFNINFQVLKVVDENVPIDEQKRDHRGYNRYYDSPIVANNKKYLLCSQWVDSLHRKAFERWLEDKLMAILISRVKVLSTGTEFGIRDQLNDFWQYVPHNTLRSLGKSFYKYAISHGNIKATEKRNNNQFYKKL